jgi:hypothetical protein
MKTHWSLRWSFFIASVISLSWFFTGWRGINEHGALADWALLIGATLLTLTLLAIQGYWIYVEELKKGSLKRRIAIYDCIHEKLASRSIPCAAEKKGEV